MNVTTTAQTSLTGHRDFRVIRGGEAPQVKSVFDALKYAIPNTNNAEVNKYRRRNVLNVTRGVARIAAAQAVGAPTMYGVVSPIVYRGCEFDADGNILTFQQMLDLGVVSCRVVTDTGVGFIVDAFQNSVEMENMKYHGFGTGTTAEAAAQTALVTELTTEYAVNSTRPTGSTTEGASANIYRTVGTLSPDASVAITEHAIFDQAATGGGVMIDRSVFSAINLVSGDSLQITYDLTFTSGS